MKQRTLSGYGRSAGSLLTVAIALCAAGGAAAQTSAPPAPTAGAAASDVETGDTNDLDIVVTAQRRSQRLQDVPLAVSAIGGEALAKQGITRLTDLTANVPNINVNRNLGATFIYVRGIGNNFLNVGGDSSVAFYENGVYIGRPRAQVAAFLDIERVEVLRGPQGTLYGRNASGGAINVITREPSAELEANARLDIGNYGLVRFEGAVGGAISGDVLTARLAVLGARHDGYGRNLVSGREIDDLGEYGARLSVRLRPSDSFDYLVSGEYYHDSNNGHPLHYFQPGRPGTTPAGLAAGGFVAPDVRDLASDAQPVGRITASGISGVGTWQPADHLTLKSTTAFRHSSSYSTSDADGTSIPLFELRQDERSDQFSQELQATYAAGGFTAISGLYYLHEKLSGATLINITAIGRLAGSGPGKGTVEAYAAYTNLSYEVLPGLTATAALRYSNEQRTSRGFTAVTVPLTPLRRQWDALTPRFALDYKITPDVLVYASISKGFKSGTLLLGSLNPPVDPEKVWAYEGGLKSQLLDRRLQVNIAVFSNDYRDLQVSRVVGNVTVTENAAAARVRGIELETSILPWTGGRFDAAISRLDSQFESFATGDPARAELGQIDLSGNALPYAPKWTANLRAEQKLDLGKERSLTFNASYVWSARVYHDPFQLRSRSQPSYAIVDARATYQPANPHWSIGLWVRNLTDKTIRTTSLVSSAATGFPILGSINDPRTFGGSLSVQF